MSENTSTNEEVFLIKLGDLPETVRENILSETKPYSVPLVINDIPLGSGTLVVIDGHYGILTAEHVVRHPNRRDLWLDNTSIKGPKLLIPPMDFPASTMFESYALRIFSTDRKSDNYGPDLAFILLPPSEVLSGLRARRSFYPLASRAEEKMTEALCDNGFIAFCGFPGSQHFQKPAQLGFTEVQELYGYSFLTGVEKYEERDHWDYFELGVDRREIANMGETFGGVSGGVWHVPVYRKKDAPVGSEYYENRTFAGVTFYEENHIPDGKFFIRTHGPRSIYEMFLPSIRKQLTKV